MRSRARIQYLHSAVGQNKINVSEHTDSVP